VPGLSIWAEHDDRERLAVCCTSGNRRSVTGAIAHQRECGDHDALAVAGHDHDVVEISWSDAAAAN